MTASPPPGPPGAPGPSGRSVGRPPTLVAVAHGSRNPEALRTVTALLDRVRALRPGLPVRLGHIELNQPLLTDTLAALRGAAVLVPLLLGRGYHIKQDIPAAVAAAPHLSVRIAAPLGPDPLLAEALHARLAEAGWPAPPQAGRSPARTGPGPTRTGRRPTHAGRPATVPHRAGVVLAAAGSRDPDAAVDAARTAALLSARLGGVPVLPGYASGSGPTVPEAVRDLAALGRDRIAVASYFTAPGRFATQCAHAAPGVAAAPLGAHPAVARLVLRRYEQALASAPVSHPAATVGV
ncbi:CbiX/SirB N-terminal domain-containing protein [Streptomyces luomodiensis]|uniref:CbiX/SirB N-terminal domain-containing protein n=1 Tax=Streptomyces luomodiensis TaxID=3026192 RepID=A0ABY9UVR2_9ACTN|nr:CbiX/SirB N-terminal domain-containing protein [Streptomyces sp. SCA4-21]WNE96401.1 CbiX/SirB N-terminal domain-containing protein [Streptomyces sp. SCA4-21]